ncbi:hypothetical protein [Nitrospirillum amazonense]|uniref:hypothetical protein n=1 Tax=Nitrospirillum amazonense TaxID=28077 RepID=UPI0011A27ED8|nr:hypothetical protein [Nitrospirillum amazonense]
MIGVIFQKQQIFSAENIDSIKKYCIDPSIICFGASVLYISCYEKNDSLMIHIIVNCVVIGMGHSQNGLNLQLAAPLGDGNYIRMASSEMASLMVGAPYFEKPVLAVADSRYIDAITAFFANAAAGSPGDPKPYLRLVKP